MRTLGTVVALALVGLISGCAYLGARSSTKPETPGPSATPSPESSVGSPLPGFVPEEEAAALIRQCGVSGQVAAYFRIPLGNDYHDHFPAMGKSPEIEGVSGAFVVVYNDPVTTLILGHPGAGTPPPFTNALCVIPPPGSAMAGEPIIYGNVSRDGMSLPPGAWINPEGAPTPRYGSGPIFDPLTISISNDTTLAITVVVNGESVGPFTGGAYQDPIDASLLPAPPWHIEARTPSGRVLTTMDVQRGDVWHTDAGSSGHSSVTGVATRVDLSCGRLDIWSGPPLAGPPPPSSFPPGDCAS